MIKSVGKNLVNVNKNDIMSLSNVIYNDIIKGINNKNDLKTAYETALNTNINKFKKENKFDDNSIKAIVERANNDIIVAAKNEIVALNQPNNTGIIRQDIINNGIIKTPDDFNFINNKLNPDPTYLQKYNISAATIPLLLSSAQSFNGDININNNINNSTDDEDEDDEDEDEDED